MTSFNACTIVSWNYLAYARLLERTLRQWNSDARLFVAIADRPADAVDVAGEPFVTISIDDLNIPRMEAMAFRYSILELNTALKPYVLEHIHERYGVDALFYFDPDIVILANLDPLLQRLASNDLLLTPHVTQPVLDTFTPDEIDLLVSGVYNLGFLGVRFTAGTKQFLRWWQDRLYSHCLQDPRSGVFTDQKWIDLAPALVEGTAVVRDDGWNVAYWNLRHRRIAQLDGGWTANGKPLLFFHYSGLDLAQPDRISRYQPQTSVADRPDVAPLLDYCRQSLLDEGHAAFNAIPYGFGRFDNGVGVAAALRRALREVDPTGARWPDPFRTGSGSFLEWLFLRSEEWPELPNLIVQLHAFDDLLRTRFPELGATPSSAVISWIVELNDSSWKFAPEIIALMMRELPVRNAVRARRGASFRRSLRVARRIWGRAVTMNPELARSTSRMTKRALKRLGIPEPFNDIPSAPSTSPPRGKGVNIVGWLTTPTGIGEISRGTVAAAEAAGIRHAEWTLTHPMYRGADTIVNAELPWDITIFHANADIVASIQSAIPRAYLEDRPRIGIWFWEISHFPLSQAAAFSAIDELWAPTQFCFEAFRPSCPIPLRVVAPCVIPRAARDGDRRGVPSDTFLFFSAFDSLSVPERKNPLGLLHAFELAAARSDRPIHLLLKVSHAEFARATIRELVRRAASLPVTVVSDTLPRETFDALMFGCDAYVSLHRSEGFGIPLVEAMYAGKPVIVTPYGGCTDFVDAETAFCVDYDLVPLARDFGPYPKGAIWAEPRIESAAELMCEVASGSASVAARVTSAFTRVRSMYAPEVAGERLRIELERARRDLNVK